MDSLAVKNLKTRLKVLKGKLTVGYTFRSFLLRDPLLSIACGGEGRFLGIIWITEGTMGEAVVANRVKKAG